jgi:hypothetical protein
VAPSVSSRPSLRDRLCNIFKLDRGTSGSSAPAATEVVHPIQMMSYQQPMPSAEPPATPTPEIMQTNARGPSLMLKHEFEKKIGANDDYSWITGQLYYVHTFDGSLWVVRYGSPEQEEKYGGSVVLAPTVSMKNFREGDLVCVHGEVIKQRASMHLGGALYRVDHVELMERAD